MLQGLSNHEKFCFKMFQTLIVSTTFARPKIWIFGPDSRLGLLVNPSLLTFPLHLDALKTVTSEEIQILEAPELRKRSAIIVNILRQCIEVCKRILLEKFQDTQCDAAGKLSQSIYVVESLLGKCHQEGELLFFTIRQDPQVRVRSL